MEGTDQDKRQIARRLALSARELQRSMRSKFDREPDIADFEAEFNEELDAREKEQQC